MIYLIFLLLLSCGGEPETKYITVPAPAPAPQKPPQSDKGVLKDWVSVSALLNEHCAICHSGAGFLQSEATFIRSNAPRRIENRTMPPTNSPKYRDWSEEIRQSILNYVRDKN